MPLKSKAKRQHPLQWILEPAEAELSFFQRPMFGCQAVYLFGRLVFVLAAKEEPWNGLLVCTSRDRHSALIGEFPCLRPHSVLGKWLYLAQSDDTFEETSRELVVRAIKNDRRIGVEPRASKRKKS
jgi:hypothetical protein